MFTLESTKCDMEPRLVITEASMVVAETRITAGDAAMAPPKAPHPSSDLPPGWKSNKDPTSGRIYYYNSKQKITQWEPPAPEEEEAPPPPPPLAPPSATQGTFCGIQPQNLACRPGICVSTPNAKRQTPNTKHQNLTPELRTIILNPNTFPGSIDLKRPPREYQLCPTSSGLVIIGVNETESMFKL
jgi:hypothetical protein